ncbi:hypothetical protein ACJX0J_015912, partial [Zea mays]
ILYMLYPFKLFTPSKYTYGFHFLGVSLVYIMVHGYNFPKKEENRALDLANIGLDNAPIHHIKYNDIMGNIIDKPPFDMCHIVPIAMIEYARIPIGIIKYRMLH